MAGCDLAETRCATLFRANSPCDIVICWTLGAHGHARELGSVHCCYRGPENPIFHRTSSTSDVVVIIQFRAGRGVRSVQRGPLRTSIRTSWQLWPHRIPICAICSSHLACSLASVRPGRDLSSYVPLSASPFPHPSSQSPFVRGAHSAACCVLHDCV